MLMFLKQMFLKRVMHTNNIHPLHAPKKKITWLLKILSYIKTLTKYLGNDKSTEKCIKKRGLPSTFWYPVKN